MEIKGGLYLIKATVSAFEGWMRNQWVRLMTGRSVGAVQMSTNFVQGSLRLLVTSFAVNEHTYPPTAIDYMFILQSSYCHTRITNSK